MGERWDRFKQEVGQMLVEKWNQGKDELANALFHGDGYMPWPGNPHPTVQQEAQRNVQVQNAVQDIRAPASPEPTRHEQDAQVYFTANDKAMEQGPIQAAQEVSAPKMTTHEQSAMQYFTPNEHAVEKATIQAPQEVAPPSMTGHEQHASMYHMNEQEQYNPGQYVAALQQERSQERGMER